MKLAFCLFKYFPYGGLQRDFLRIALECRSRGHEVVAFTSRWRGERPSHIEVRQLPCWRLTNHGRNAAFHGRLQAELSTRAFDAVIGFDKMPGLDLYYAADTCFAARARLRHGRLYRLTRRYRHFRQFEQAVFGAGSTTDILLLSEREESVYRQFYLTAEQRFHRLPAILDSARRLTADADGARRRVRRELDVEDTAWLLLFIGSRFKTKGLERVLAAVAALPGEQRARVRLAVVGDDDSRGYQRLARRMCIDDRVRFLGGRGDVPELLAAADLLVHPALSESAGAVLLEAVAAGVPVLTTDVCGYAVHVEQAQAGVVLPSPFDQRRFNNTLSEMLTTPQREQWSRNGRTYGSDPALYRMPARAADIIEGWVDANHGGRHRPTAESPALYLRDELRRSLGQAARLDEVLSLGGQLYRQAPGRRTLRFERGGRAYFLKTHTGVGWREIVKNLLYFRLPVLGAANEWHGIHHLHRLGIDVPPIAGYGTDSRSPARRRSFIITDELADTVSLEAFCERWAHQAPPSAAEVRLKRQLIQRLASISRLMHANGANHRDYYLCHFLLEHPETAAARATVPRLYLIDMHRMQLRRRTPTRWRVKDIAGLHFSSMHLPLTSRDRLRFVSAYRDKPLREILPNEASFWRQVTRRAASLAAAERRRSQRRGTAAATGAAPSA